MDKRKLFAISIILIIPLAFFIYYSIKQDEAGIRKLSRLGPKQLNKAGTDTLYHTLTDFTLITHTGDSISRDDLLGNIHVADFFFTSCPSICPVMSNQMERIQNAFYHNDSIKLVSYTVDPVRDTVETLDRYATLHDAKPGKWHFVTGDKKDLYKLARKGYFVTATEGDGGVDDFIHSDRFILVDKEGIIRGYYTGTDSAEVNNLIKDIGYLQMEYEMNKYRKREKEGGETI